MIPKVYHMCSKSYFPGIFLSVSLHLATHVALYAFCSVSMKIAPFNEALPCFLKIQHVLEYQEQLAKSSSKEVVQEENNRYSFRFLICPTYCYIIMLQGVTDCMSSPKKSSIVLVTYIGHLNATVDLYMKAWVKEETGWPEHRGDILFNEP